MILITVRVAHRGPPTKKTEERKEEQAVVTIEVPCIHLQKKSIILFLYGTILLVAQTDQSCYIIRIGCSCYVRRRLHHHVHKTLLS